MVSSFAYLLIKNSYRSRAKIRGMTLVCLDNYAMYSQGKPGEMLDILAQENLIQSLNRLDLTLLRPNNSESLLPDAREIAEAIYGSVIRHVVHNR